MYEVTKSKAISVLLHFHSWPWFGKKVLSISWKFSITILYRKKNYSLEIGNNWKQRNVWNFGCFYFKWFWNCVSLLQNCFPKGNKVSVCKYLCIKRFFHGKQLLDRQRHKDKWLETEAKQSLTGNIFRVSAINQWYTSLKGMLDSLQNILNQKWMSFIKIQSSLAINY